MKKRIITLILAAVMTAGAQAWNTSDTEYIPVAKAGETGQSLVNTTKAANGNTVVTWLNVPSGKSTADADGGFYVYMQIYDATGKALLPEGGKVVVAQHTLSWTSGYGVGCLKNGNIVIAYNDNRAQNEDDHTRVYAYCFNQEGESVWEQQGVLLRPTTNHNDGSDIAARLVISDDNIYVSMQHTEIYRKTIGNVPVGPSVTESNYQIFRLNATDGTMAWDEPLVLEGVSTLFMEPAPEGCFYKLFTDENVVLHAERINADGKNVWEKSITVCAESLSSYGFLTALPTAHDDEGNLVIALTVPLDYIHYNAVTVLHSDGTLLANPVCGSGDTTIGTSEMPELAVRGTDIFEAWPYALTSAEQYVWCNMLTEDGRYAWTGEKEHGFKLDTNSSSLGVKTVKVIPQSDGWVVLYGNGTSWNGADFMAVKIDNQGTELWRKQLGEHDFKSSGFSVLADESKALIFFTREELEAGMTTTLNMMCVDITNEGNGATGIAEHANTATPVVTRYLDPSGRECNAPRQGVTLKTTTYSDGTRTVQKVCK